MRDITPCFLHIHNNENDDVFSDYIASTIASIIKENHEITSKLLHILNTYSELSGLNEFKIFDLDSHFNTSQYTLEVITPLDDIKNNGTPFEKYTNRLGISVSVKSNPFMILNNTIFTEDGIHILEKSPFRKKNIFTLEETRF